MTPNLDDFNNPFGDPDDDNEIRFPSLATPAAARAVSHASTYVGAARTLLGYAGDLLQSDDSEEIEAGRDCFEDAQELFYLAQVILIMGGLGDVESIHNALGLPWLGEDQGTPDGKGH